MERFITRRPKTDDSHPNEESLASEHDEPQRPPKRLKTEIPDSESEPEGTTSHIFDDSLLENGAEPGAGRARTTDFENALPVTEPDEETIKEYQSFKLSQTNNSDGETTEKTRPMWIKGKSSIYVDAFNLALDTVLDEESHLFDDKEKDIFCQWRELDYEAQFMYDIPSILKPSVNMGQVCTAVSSQNRLMASIQSTRLLCRRFRPQTGDPNTAKVSDASGEHLCGRSGTTPWT